MPAHNLRFESRFLNSHFSAAVRLVLLATVCATLVACSGKEKSFHRDQDGDGYGDPTDSQTGALAPFGYVENDEDCDDDDPDIHPGVTEICDLVDNNCDGIIDEDFTTEWYADSDEDGYAGGEPTVSCLQPPGLVADTSDCNDGDATIHPDASEVCNGIDDDCDGTLDEGYPGRDWYQDYDNDKWGSDEVHINACQPPPNTGIWLSRGGDCNDQDSLINPSAQELCDHIDNDCNDQVDDDAIDQPTWYDDNDGDGFGDPTLAHQSCYPVIHQVPNGDDCNDAASDIHPYHAEWCDGVDNNCNGQTDEAAPLQRFYRDIDQDGFGDSDENVQDCAPITGFSELRGDCDDQDAQVHPGADDTDGDGQDSDCGGTEDADPSLGLANHTYNYLRDAMAAITGNQTLWIGPGHYVGSGAALFSRVTLASVGPMESTILEVDGTGSLAVAGSGGNVTVDALSLRGREVPYPGYALIYVTGATLTVKNSAFRGNRAWSGSGAAIQVYDDPFEGKTDSKVTLTNSLFEYNAAYSGGVISVVNTATLTASHCTFRHNFAGIGGVFYGFYADATFSDSLFYDNHASSQGGLFYANTQTHLEVGASVLMGNSSQDVGGVGTISATGSISIHDSVVLENAAPKGAGFFFYPDSYGAVLMSTILAYQAGEDFYFQDLNQDMKNVSLYQTSIVQDEGIPVTNGSLDMPAFEDAIFAPPQFVYYTRNRNPLDDDFHLQPDSFLRSDNIQPTPEYVFAPDQAGLYSTSYADADYYNDADLDGLYDGWELAHALVPLANDSALDPDNDGIRNIDELLSGLLPDRADTDGDLSRDGDEKSAGSDPLDYFSRPNQPYPATVKVPDDFPTIQAAVDAATHSLQVELAPGSYAGAEIAGKSLDITAPEGDVSIEPQSNSVVTEGRFGMFSLIYGQLSISNMNLSGGFANRGGCLTVFSGDLTADALTFEGCSAMDGGTLNLERSTAFLANLTINGSSASNHAGSIHMLGSQVEAFGLRLTDSMAMKNGGAIAVFNSQVLLDGLWINGSAAEDGAGIYSQDSQLKLSHVRVENASASIKGAAIRAKNCELDLSGAAILNNDAPSGGGVLLENCAFVLDHVVITRNRSSTGSGLYVVESSDSTQQGQLLNSILAYNQGDNLLAEQADGSVATRLDVQFSDLYAIEGGLNHNLPSLPSSNVNLEPGFLSMDANGPTSLHLSTTSALIGLGLGVDADGSSADLGIFGGSDGDTWDLDLDGAFDYFWPGAFGEAPSGVDLNTFDRNDLDATVK